MKTGTRKSQKISRAHRRRSADEVSQKLALSADTVWFWAIFACAFLLRAIYVFQIESIPLFYYLAGDGRTYDEWAQRIAAGDWLGTGVFYQAPLYPYFLGVLQIFFGHSLWLIRLMQITLGATACAIVFRVGQSLFSRSAGIAAGLIVSFYAPGIFFDALIEKSILDLFLLSLLLLLLVQRRQNQQSIQWAATGAVLGLLGLSRENALVLASLLPFWIGFHFSEKSILKRFQWIGFFFAGLLIVLAPISLRNFVVGGEFKLTTSQFGPNFYIGNNPSADGTYASVRNVIRAPHFEGQDATRLAERELGRSLTAGEVSDYWFQKSWNYIRTEPLGWLRLMGKKWLMVWNAREVEDSDDYYIYQQWSGLLSFLGWINHFGLLAPLAGAGFWLTRHQWRRLWLLYAMTLGLAAGVAIFYVFGRYRFPLVPLLALFAGAGLVESANLYKQRAWRPLLSTLAVFVFICAVVNWPIYGITGPGPGGYNNLANAYSKQGRIDEAIQTALKAIELQPAYGVAHYNLGNLYAQQGRFDLAQTHFEEAVRLYPNHAEARNSLGQLMAERHGVEKGIAYFRKAIELNPSLGRAHLNLGIALAHAGRIQEATSSLEKAVQLTPESAEAHHSLGSVYAAQERYDGAAAAFKDALRIQPDYAEAHESLARLLTIQGKKEEAVQHYREALRLVKQKASVPHGP